MARAWLLGVRHKAIPQLLLLSVLLALIGSAAGYLFTQLDPASAGPGLNVSKSASTRALLGGQTSFLISIENTGDAKGYNLSITDVVSSSRPNPQGKVTFVSATDGSGDLVPTSVVTDSGTGDTTIKFTNIKDLAQNENYSIRITVDLSGDASWQINDLVNNNVTATVNTVPDGSGTDINGASAASTKVVPITVVTKTVNQSTGVEQATGTLDRTYSNTVNVQNNYVNVTNSVVVTDTVPDGVEYLGMISPPASAPVVSRNAGSGVTTLVWSLGNMAAGASQVLTYRTGIRYDYYGTANSGTNRAHDDFDGSPPVGTPIPDKTNFTNTADLRGTYLGQPATDTASASVTGAYLTTSKGISPSTGGNGTVATYTITYYSSEYYDILDTIAPASIVVTDTVPDGQTYNVGSATPAPDSVVHNADGTTDLYWKRPALGHSSQSSIIFSVTIDDAWEGAPYTGRPIVSGDSMTNRTGISGEWDDLVDTGRPNGTSRSAASASFSTGIPDINKKVLDPFTGLWSDSVTATVGDRLTMRVRFNTDDGANPTRSDIRFGNIAVTDWLPRGTVYNGDAAPTSSVPTSTYFSDPDTATPPPINLYAPTTPTIGGLNGLEWFLGNVEKGGWWETTFTVTVVDTSTVANNVTVSNMWKLTGINTPGETYSKRAAVPVLYGEPTLSLSKSAVSVPSPLVASSDVTYTLSITNSGLAAAQSMVVTDTLPAGMRETAPVISSVTLAGSPLTEGVHYKQTYAPATGVWVIDFYDASPPSVEASVPPGKTLIITYRSRVDANPVQGAGSVLTNNASLTYSSQSGGGRTYGPVNAIANVTLASATIRKTGPSGPFTIGDTYTYSVEVTVPAGLRAYWPNILDTLNRDGFDYVYGTSTLTTISGTPPVPAAFATTQTPTRAGTATTTTFLWNLANFIDNWSQSNPYVFRLTFDVRITGLEDNGSREFYPPGANDQVTNSSAVFRWNTTNVGARATDRTATSGTAVTNIDQPWLTLNKYVTTPGPYVAGQTIAYSIDITNTGWWTAYDSLFTDSLPLGMRNTTPTVTSITLNGVPLSEGSGYKLLPVYDSTTGTFTIDFNDTSPPAVDTSIPVGQAIRIRYTTKIDTTAGAGMTLRDIATVGFNSRDDGSGRVYPGTTIVADPNTDDEQITVVNPVMTKTQTAPSNKATIGDVCTYTVTSAVPTDTTMYNTEMTDLVPDGLTVLDATSTPAVGTLTFVERPTGDTSVTWTIGDVTNPPATQLQMTMRVRVDDTYFNGVKLDGLPLAIDGDAQDARVNSGRVAWDDAKTGGTARGLTSNTTTLTITEPHMAMTKTPNPTTAAASDVITYTVSLVNTGTSTAYDLLWVDTVPPELFNPPTSPVFVLAAKNAVTLVEGIDFTKNFLANPVSVSTTLTGGAYLAPTDTLTVTYRATVPGGVRSGQALVNTATVVSYTSQLGPDINERISTGPTTTATVIAKAPAFVSDKQVISDSTPQRGGVVDYRYTVTNVGDATSTGVWVQDVQPWPDLTYQTGSTVATWPAGSSTADPGVAGGTLTWNLGAVLGPGQRLTINYRSDVATDAALGVKTNTASAWGGDLGGVAVPAISGVPADTDSDDSDPAAVTVTNPELSIDKGLAPGEDGIVPIGGTFSYEITVTNTGDTTMTTVPLTDTFDSTHLAFVSAVPAENSSGPGTVNWNDITGAGSLGVGASTVVTATFRVTAAGASIPDTATVSGAVDVNGDSPATVSDTDSTLLGTNPRVAVDKGLTPGQDPIVAIGDTVSYEITVTNSGDTTLTTVPLFDTYDAARLAFVSAIPVETSTGAGTVGWSDLTGVGDLGVGDDIVVRVVLRVTAAGASITDSATVAGAIDVNGDTAPTATSADSTLLGTNPHVAVSKGLAPGEDGIVPIGELVSYDITVTNDGDTTLTVVPLTDTYDSSHLAFVSATPSEDSSGAGTLTWNDLTGAGTLGVGASTTVRVVFRVTAAGASITDTATVSGATDVNDDAAPDATDSDSTLLGTGPELSIDKGLAPGEDGIVPIGNTFSYEITVTNTGDTTMTTVPLTDTFDSTHLAFVSAVPAENSSGPGTVNWNDITGAGSLGVSQSTAVTVTFRVIAAGSSVTDTATVSGAVDVNGDSPATVTDSDSTLLGTNPHVAVEKGLAPGQSRVVPIGGMVSYEITVTNDGDTVLDTVPLSDTYDDTVLAFVAALPTEDTSAPGTVTWNDITGVGMLDVGESATVRVTFAVVAEGADVLDTAQVSGATDVNGDTAPDDSDDDQTLQAYDPGSVVVSKTANPPAGTIMLPGQEITYAIGYANNGNVPLPASIVVDALENSIDFVSGSMMVDGVPQTDGAGDDAGSWNPATRAVTFDVGDLLAQQTGVATFRVRVRPVAYSYRGVRNVAVMTSDGTQTAQSDPVIHPVDPIKITKTGKDINGGRLRAGDVILWTITVRNVGLTQTTHVVVTDRVPKHTTYVSRSIMGRGKDDSAAPNLRWDVGTMQINETVVLTFKSRVDAGISNGTRIRNQATVRSDQSLPKRSDNPATTAANDSTMLLAQTAGDELLYLGLALAAFIVGTAMAVGAVKWPERRS